MFRYLSRRSLFALSAFVAFFALALIAALALGQFAHAATFTVTNTSNSGVGSLRQAILDANASGGTDTITFSIPGVGPHTIAPTSALPTITDPVIIDGYSQPGASANTNPIGLGSNAVLMIELDGASAGASVDGLRITAGSSTVKGLVINRFQNNGILITTNGANAIEGNHIGTDLAGSADLGNSGNGVNINGAPSNTIGGTAAGARNVISGNDNHGIVVEGSSATGNLVQGNYIGTDATGGDDVGNSFNGVIVAAASFNTIGGTSSGARNVISGNDQTGVRIALSGATGNLVQGNYIGTDTTGSVDLGNSMYGVVSADGGNTIGGTASGARNVISGNNDSGVRLSCDIGCTTTGTLVQGNYIGTDVTGSGAVGNSAHGVEIFINANNNTVGGSAGSAANTIAYNGGDGVIVVFATSGTGNLVSSNSIHSNTGLGIDLALPFGVTPNDPGDNDAGANNLQNFPVLSSASTSGSSTTIQGTLNSTANTTLRLEFFSNTVCDPSLHGEGETFQGFTNVTTDGSGNVSFTATGSPAPPSQSFFTATATDPLGNTSEFSACIVGIVSPSPSPTPSPTQHIEAGSPSPTSTGAVGGLVDLATTGGGDGGSGATARLAGLLLAFAATGAAAGGFRRALIRR